MGEVSGVVRCLYVMAGSVALGIGLVGVVVPLLPTTPFLLLAAACYARGSKRLEERLMRSPLIGTYLHNYQKGRTMSLRSKTTTLVILWAGIGATIILMVDGAMVRALLVVIALAVSLHILTLGKPNIETPDGG